MAVRQQGLHVSLRARSREYATLLRTTTLLPSISPGLNIADSVDAGPTRHPNLRVRQTAHLSTGQGRAWTP